MYHPIVKEQVLPGQLEGLQTNANTSETHVPSQPKKPTNFENTFALWISPAAQSPGFCGTRADFLECGGLTPLSYGEARLAREEQRLLLLRVLSCSPAALGSQQSQMAPFQHWTRNSQVCVE
jgi:hypothetical protein